MELQDIFYIIGIVFMLSVLGIVLGIALIAWYIRKKVLDLIRKPQDTVSDVVTGLALRLKKWGK